MLNFLNRQVSRRDFLHLGSTVAAAVAFANIPEWARAASVSAASSRKTLVVLFQRGAADGLNIVVPFADVLYQKSRPTIALGQPGHDKGVLDLDGTFGFHPALAAILPLWRDGNLAVVQAVGSMDGTRSHFDAQDNMETGTPGLRVTADGWLNRSLRTLPMGPKGTLAAVAVSPRLPRILRGAFPVTAFANLQSYRFRGGTAEEATFEQMYDRTIDRLLSGAGKETHESVAALQKVLSQSPGHPEDAGYPKGKEGQDFWLLAIVNGFHWGWQREA
jgi:uncharacterized protein (DUF1501 family)